MASTAKAGIAFFLIVFATGFLLGTLRVLLLAPTLGETTAVLVELPIMLVIAWVAAGGLINRYAVPADPAARALMGSTGFVLLMLAEFLLGWLGFGRAFADQIAAFRTLPGALGLAGQVAFGILPLFVRAADT